MNSALWEALMAERVRDRQISAAWSRCARRARRDRRDRRARHSVADNHTFTAQGSASCAQAISLHNA
jgi:hypothetical protein